MFHTDHPRLSGRIEAANICDEFQESITEPTQQSKIQKPRRMGGTTAPLPDQDPVLDVQDFGALPPLRHSLQLSLQSPE